MNCRRVEKLIALYVEGDLASGPADRLASHLEWCGRCNWLADEYKESQRWLRSSEPPEFDQAALNGFKAGVLRRIQETAAEPSLLMSLMRQWSRRQALALSAAMLIIFGVVVFYVYKARPRVNPRIGEIAEQAPERESPQSTGPQQSTDTKPAPGATFSKQHRANNQAKIKARTVTPVIAEQSIEPPLVSQTNLLEEPGAAPSQPTDPLPGGGDDSPGMLRIEIQTSDPNIRIIWFAPKEVGSPQTN